MHQDATYWYMRKNIKLSAVVIRESVLCEADATCMRKNMELSAFVRSGWVVCLRPLIRRILERAGGSSLLTTEGERKRARDKKARTYRRFKMKQTHTHTHAHNITGSRLKEK